MENLKKLSEYDLKALYTLFRTSELGILSDEANERLEKYGLNEITNKKEKEWYIQLILSFISPFNFILVFLAIVSLFTDVIFASKNERNWTSIVIVLTMVVISSFIKFFQEYRSNKAAKSLKNLVRTEATIIRGGQVQEISLKEVVPGDIVKLAAGDMIPADIRVTSSKDLFISQSMLTGESEPIEKIVLRKENPENITDISNILLMGTNIVSGSATGIVLQTGNNTYLSTIIDTLNSVNKKTNFEKGIDRISNLLIKFMLIMVPIVFIINGVLKNSWLESILFSISVAVGLTPEMLPMIVTGNLAKGAIALAKKKTVVKKLDAIQNFGAMNILCTDKTGTLTLDRVTVVKYLNLDGESDDTVLKYGYLNSFFQTGLKNLMDRAILEFEEEHIHLQNTYKKIDELPFDFERRRMSVILEDTDFKRIMVTKGAIEEMLSICSYAQIKKEIAPLNEKIKQQIIDMSNELNKDGMRVIGISKKDLSENRELNFNIKDESEEIFVGYIGFLDPPKEDVKEVIKSLKNYGIQIKVLTGDSPTVTQKICNEIGIDSSNMLLGGEIESMDDIQLQNSLSGVSIFAKLSPMDKSRIIKSLQTLGNTVGFLGDGINDALALKQADVGISVDTGMDIAKESADIILLEKDLMVLLEGVIDGRKIFMNMIKYIKMTASSNFGNVFSVVIASIFLPFLPMMPIQLLFQNLLYDISQISIPWDNVDKEDIIKPQNWNAEDVGRFMIYIGPISSIFDIITFLLMFYIFSANSIETQSIFHTGWFIEGLLSQTLIIHMIRTKKIPFIQSRANIRVILLTFIVMSFGVYITYTRLGTYLGLVSLNLQYFIWLTGILIGYFILTLIVKEYYINKFKTWL